MSRPKPGSRSLEPEVSAYVEGLRMLGRRELSEAQVRDRLARKGYEAEAVDDAVNRLLAERAIDDARVAEAIAHTETTVRRHGKLRVRQRIEQAGIAPATARRAVETAFGAIDDVALIEGAIASRLRGGDRIADPAEFRKLYRFLIGQGFEPDRVIAVLNNHKGH